MLKYLFIKNYRNVLNQINLNFGSEYIFSINEKELIIENNEDYISNLYKNNNSNVECISGIIGKNRAGKTTIFRAINDIFTGKDIEYVAVFEEENKFVCINSLKAIDLKCNYKNVKKKNVEILNNKNNKKYIDSQTLVYSSNIFDKSSVFNESENVIDISTNTLVRNYVENNYKTNIELAMNNSKLNINNILEEKCDLIEEFKKYEIVKKIRYYNKLNIIMNDIQDSEKKFKRLFDFPENLKLSFGDDTIGISKIIDEIYTKDEIMGEWYITIYNYLNDILLEDYSMDSLKNRIIQDFICYVLFEVLYKVKIEYNGDIEDMLNYLYKKIISKQEIEINYRFFDDLLSSILKRKIYHYKDSFIESDENNFEIVRNVEGNDIIVDSNEDYNLEYDEINVSEATKLILEERIKKNVAVLRGMDYGNDLDFEKELIDIFDFYKDMGSLFEEWNHFAFFENNIYRLFELEDAVFGMAESNYNRYKPLKGIIETGSTYVPDDYLELIYDYITEQNLLIENVVQTIEHIERKKNKQKSLKKRFAPEKIETDFIEDSIEIKNYINKIRELLDFFNEIVDNNEVLLDEDWINLSCSWKDDKIAKFIELFKETDMETFYIVFDHEEISSGHRAYLDMYCRINDKIDTIGLNKKDKVIFLIDEGDIYLHPSIQVEFVINLLQFFSLFMDKVKIQIIITSNSPFIVSDIPHTNLIYIENNDGVIKKNNNYAEYRTFGANINNLLIESFYMDTGTVGFFAKEIINDIISKLRTDNSTNVNKEEIYKMINIIGEPIIKEKLLKMYNQKFRNDEQTKKQLIEYYRNKLRALGYKED